MKIFHFKLDTQKYKLMYLRMRYSIDKSDLEALEERIRMEEFLIFCQTGKFPA